MDLFHEVPDEQVIIVKRGLYKQCKLYHRGGKLYANIGYSFVQLLADHGTSSPYVRWVELSYMYAVGKFEQPMLTIREQGRIANGTPS